MLFSERLESRRLLASFALSSKGTLTILGDATADVIRVYRAGKYIRAGANAEGGRFLAAQVKRLYIDAAAGNDRVVVETPLRSTLIGGPGNDKLIGSSANDFLEGNGGKDTLIAGAGDDVLNAGPGPNLICPGDGMNTGSFRYGDTFDYFDATPGEYLFSNTYFSNDSEISGNVQVRHVGVNDAFDGPARRVGTLTFLATPKADVVTTYFGYTMDENDAVTHDVSVTTHGGGGNDTLMGDGGNLFGDEGDDRFVFGDGEADSPVFMDGGTGDDTYFNNNYEGFVYENERNRRIADTAGNDLLILDSVGYAPDEDNAVFMPDSIERLKATTNSHPTSVYGNALSNEIKLTGNAPITIDAGAGNDVVHVTDTQQVTVYGGDGDDLIDAEALPHLDDPFSIVLSGNAGNDTLLGTDGPDTLNGNGGADRLLGRGGDDLLIADDGRRDTLDGGDGNDIAHIDVSDLLASIETID